MAFGIVLLIALAVIVHRYEQNIARLEKQQREVCTRLEWDLEAIVGTPRARAHLHERMAYHHLDEGLLQLCFGNPAVVNSRDADNCWISKGSDDCYLDLAKQLLDAYRARHR